MEQRVEKQSVARLLKINPTTLSRREKGGVIPRPHRSIATRKQFYVQAELCRALAELRRVDLATGLEYPSDWSAGFPKDWLTAADLAKRLGVTKYTVLRWARQRTAPHYRIGPHTVRFLESEIRRWCRYHEDSESMFFWLGRDRKRDKFILWLHTE